jgi:hypothetical protein
MIRAVISAVLFLSMNANSNAATHQDFLKALAAVEDGQGRVTDHGKGIGCFSIHRDYWMDAVRACPELARVGYRHCSSPLYSWQIVEAYLRHHAPASWDAKDWFRLAQIHHVGPTGARKGRGKAFAARVVDSMTP